MPIGHELVEQIRVKVDGADIDPEIMDQVLEVIVDSSLYLPDMCIIHLVDDDDFGVIESSKFDIGKVVEIELGFDEPAQTTERIFKGEITALEPSYNADMTTTYTVRAYSKAHRLIRGTKMRAFLNVTDSDMVNQIAGENGLSATVESTPEVYKHVFQHNQTDMEFLSERAQRIGYEVFVDDNKLYFRKPKGARGEVSLEWGEGLRTFNPRMSTSRQVSKVSVISWDMQKKEAIRGESSSSSSEPQIGYGKNGIQSSTSAFSNAEEFVTRRPVNTQREAETLAKALLDEINAGFVEADGVTIGNPKLKAGIKVEIKSVGRKFSGKYMVTAARHVYTPDGYETHFTVQGTRPQLMSDMVKSHSVFADEDRFYNGVVPAIVTNINDPETKGRIKVKFPWMSNTLESTWARLATIGAGNQRGILWLPEVNDEVLVAFEHGDFNRPFIIGSLWNGKDAPPDPWNQASQGGKSEIRTFKSREGHTIRFVDGPSDQYIEIVDSQQGTTIKLDANTKKLSIESKDEISVKTNTNLKIETTGKTEVKSTSDITIESSTSVTIKGNANVTVEGSGTLDLKSNGMVNIKGSMVNIN